MRHESSYKNTKIIKQLFKINDTAKTLPTQAHTLIKLCYWHRRYLDL